MLDVLQFIFRSFWTWLGTVVLCAVIVSPFSGMFRVVYRATKGREKAIRDMEAKHGD